MANTLDGIAAKLSKVNRPSASAAWTSNEDSLLGTATDKEVGKLVGRHYLAVAERRRSLDILPGGRTRKEWTLAEMRLLGTAADQDIALRLGRTVASVQEKRFVANIRAR